MASITLTTSDENVDRIMAAFRYNPEKHGTKSDYFKLILRRFLLGRIRSHEAAQDTKTAQQEFLQNYAEPDIT
jgi:hypothetical protein